MYKMNSKKLMLVLSAIFFISSKAGFAGALESKKEDGLNVLAKSEVYDTNFPKEAADSSNKYSPYLQVGGTRFFNVGDANKAMGLDFFIPLWQSPANLVFTDIRFYDRNGKPFEGNLHLGYRHLDEENQHLYGVYAAFDRKRTDVGSYFSQLTLGAECWLDRFFIGGNFYQPIGSSSRYLETGKFGLEQDKADKSVWVTKDGQHEKAMGGVDAEVGYEIIDGLACYVGGYYFGRSDVSTSYGPKARMTYDWFFNKGKHALGIFDKIGLETGVQHDKPRGTTWYLSANLRIGLPNKNAGLQGVARHMVDLVRRDVDIVTRKTKEKSVRVEEAEDVVDENGVRIAGVREIDVSRKCSGKNCYYADHKKRTLNRIKYDVASGKPKPQVGPTPPPVVPPVIKIETPKPDPVIVPPTEPVKPAPAPIPEPVIPQPPILEPVVANGKFVKKVKATIRAIEKVEVRLGEKVLTEDDYNSGKIKDEGEAEVIYNILKAKLKKAQGDAASMQVNQAVENEMNNQDY